MNWLSRFVSGTRPELPAAAAAKIAQWQEGERGEQALPHFETRYVVVNTEATGLNLDKDRLLAVAAIAIEGRSLKPSNALYRPLDDDPAEGLADLLEFAGHAPWVVFNASFNRKLLERVFEARCDFEPDVTWMDLQWLMPALFPEFHTGQVRLVDWMESFGVETFQRHHALGDAYAIAQLLMAALGRAHDTGAINARSLIEIERSRRWNHRTV
ncbi:MAG: 3'-5' exonuclease [Rhodocyclaceae bacterium]|nr:3'-5' exonuclease [Rhodocyclaceae bacterium]